MSGPLRRAIALPVLLCLTLGSSASFQAGIVTRHAVPDVLLPGGPRLTLATRALRSEEALLRIPASTVMTAELAAGRHLFDADWRHEQALATSIGPRFDRSACADCHREARPVAARTRSWSRATVDGLVPRGSPAVLSPDPLGERSDEPLRVVRAVAGASFPLGTDGPARAQLTRYTSASARPSRRLALDFVHHAGHFDDGETFDLRSLVARLSDGERVLSDDRFALRVAPALFGWGLLGSVDADTIARMSDPDDRDGDGISGRLAVADGAIGRFGWKAGQPTLRRQSAAALHHDMGVTTDEFPGEHCVDGKRGVDDEQAEQGKHRGTIADTASPGDCAVELSGAALDALVAYVSSLGVPDRRDRDSDAVQRGGHLFAAIGCADCHVPVLPVSTSGSPGAEGQTLLWPYSDLLLHDMGDGLADPSSFVTATDGGAETGAALDTVPAGPREWRTPPLWGIGLLDGRNGQRFLHDGRARTPLEAALWHGGEGEAARRRLLSLSSADRDALTAFLGSL